MPKQKKEETQESAQEERAAKETAQQEQEFSFPEHRRTIKASSLEEAKKKLHEELKKHKTL